MKNVMSVVMVTILLTVPVFAGSQRETESERVSRDPAPEMETEIQVREIPYSVDGKTFIGYLARDSRIRNSRPGVIVVHEWLGINDYARKRVRDLAAEGYVAFALDMYGEGKEVAMSEARTISSTVGSDFALIEKRFNAAIDILKSQENVDSNRIAAIGYCFGGGVVLNMARLGTEIRGVVSFHGSLNTGLTANAGDIKTKILAFQGDGDPAAPVMRRDTFISEMETSGADFEYVVFENVNAHNFTNPEGSTYYGKEAEMAWDKMREFFDRIFE